jgi:hypothetical protein
MATSTTAAASPPHARRRPGMLPGLHIDLGRRTRDGDWSRQPAAWYWCGRCGHVLTARGAEFVPQFLAGVRAAHAPLCPGREPSGGGS